MKPGARYQLVVRWFLRVGKLPGNVPTNLWCQACGKRPPERTEFIDFGEREFHCHDCLRAAMADSEVGKDV